MSKASREYKAQQKEYNNNFITSCGKWECVPRKDMGLKAYRKMLKDDKRLWKNFYKEQRKMDTKPLRGGVV